MKSWKQELFEYLRTQRKNVRFPENEERDTDDTVVEKYSKSWFETEYMPVSMSCELDASNGMNLLGYYLPEEMLHLLLSFADLKDLLSCRQVCHRWRIAVDSQIWMLKFNKNIYKMLKKLNSNSQIPFWVFYKVCKNGAFNKNLLRNPCGEDGFNHWFIRENGGDQWIVENPPLGSSPLEGTNSCFVTSYRICMKDQLVDLVKEGLLPIIMDEIRPTIYVSEKFTGRFDCTSTYTLDVTLLDRGFREVDKFFVQKSTRSNEWQKVEYVFENYPQGVRFVRFRHSGKDLSFLTGHYGSKMSQACVMVFV